MKTIIITGGAGFIGSHLAEALLPNYNVVVIDNMLTGDYKNINHLFDQYTNFRCVKQDITEPLHLWEHFIDSADYILHLASPASPKHYADFPIETLKVNSIGTHNVLELTKKFRARLLVTSTSEVYGDPLVHPQDEDYFGNVNPIGLRACYDEGKRYMEATVSTYERKFNLNTCIVRLFNTYGPRMGKNDGRVVPEFINSVIENRPLLVNNGQQTRSLCYISDTVDGILAALFSDYHGPLNIGNPDEVSIIDLAYEIIALSDSPSSQIQILPSVQDDPKMRKPDISLIKKLTGWEPKVTRNEGLMETIKHYKTAGFELC